jgi:hypothetical protein
VAASKQISAHLPPAFAKRMKLNEHLVQTIAHFTPLPSIFLKAEKMYENTLYLVKM